MGWRLSTRRNPYAYGVTVYDKGAFVLHMLRMMMREGGKNADARFIAMMHDFCTTYAQQSPRTSDFQRIVEKHMTPAMNLAGDGHMSWFFRQWIEGTDVPRYKVQIESAKEGEGYRLKGTLRQEAVGPDFRAVVPLYAEFGKNEIAKIGAIPMQGTTDFPVDVMLKLPKKPRRIFVNALQEVLTRD
jgi:aminopeptidase N